MDLINQSALEDLIRQIVKEELQKNAPPASVSTPSSGSQNKTAGTNAPIKDTFSPDEPPKNNPDSFFDKLGKSANPSSSAQSPAAASEPAASAAPPPLTPTTAQPAKKEANPADLSAPAAGNAASSPLGNSAATKDAPAAKLGAAGADDSKNSVPDMPIE